MHAQTKFHINNIAHSIGCINILQLDLTKACNNLWTRKHRQSYRHADPRRFAVRARTNRHTDRRPRYHWAPKFKVGHTTLTMMMMMMMMTYLHTYLLTVRRGQYNNWSFVEKDPLPTLVCRRPSSFGEGWRHSSVLHADARCHIPKSGRVVRPFPAPCWRRTNVCGWYELVALTPTVHFRAAICRSAAVVRFLRQKAARLPALMRSRRV